MSDKWVCIEINTTFHHGDVQAVAKKIKEIFGKDLREVRFVCNDVLFQSGTYYCFVLCLNYQNHVQDLKGNSLYYSVVPCCESPNWLTTFEVDQFVMSVEKSTAPENFSPGDLVQVKDGYLKNLYGLVVKKGKENHYRISFRFHLRKFMESLPTHSMRLVDNIFNHRKFPLTRRSLKGARKLVGSHKIHRKKYRKCNEEKHRGWS